MKSSSSVSSKTNPFPPRSSRKNRGPFPGKSSQGSPGGWRDCIARICLASILGLVLAGCGDKDKEEEAKGRKTTEHIGSKSRAAVTVSLIGKSNRAPGDIHRLERTLEFLDANVTTGGGAPTQGSISIIDRQEFLVEELEDGRRSIEVEKMSVEMSVESGAEPAVEELKSPLHGRTLIGEADDGGNWSFGIDGAVPDESEKEALAQFAEIENLENERFPSDDLDLNQKWKAGTESIRSIIGPQFEPTSGEAEFMLARLTKFDGHRCADIEVNIVLSGSFPGQDPPLVADIKLKGNILRSLNTYRDLKTSLEGTITLKGQHPSGASIEITAPAKLKQVWLRAEEE